MNALAPSLRRLAPSQVFVVADRRVVELHGMPDGVPSDAARVLLHVNHATKRFAVWRSIVDAMVDAKLDRDAVVVAYGGGTVLDVAGFAAASYLRGVRWIAVATTLLAQVDAAHGGKTGIDHERGKNLVGAFHEPSGVWTPTAVLSTLEPREVRCGLAEIIKHGVIARPDLVERAGRDDPATLVDDAKQVKLHIVSQDLKEQGVRRWLNLGHTLGHAVEQASGYELGHGDAVGVGLRAACFLAERHCGFNDSGAVLAALDRCGHPARVDLEAAAVRAALRHDKKRRADKLRWVLPRRLGEVDVFDDVPQDLVTAAIAEILA